MFLEESRKLPCLEPLLPFLMPSPSPASAALTMDAILSVSTRLCCFMLLLLMWDAASSSQPGNLEVAIIGNLGDRSVLCWLSGYKSFHRNGYAYCYIHAAIIYRHSHIFLQIRGNAEHVMVLPLQPQTPCKAGHKASDAWNTLFINAEASAPIRPCNTFASARPRNDSGQNAIGEGLPVTGLPTGWQSGM